MMRSKKILSSVFLAAGCLAPSSHAILTWTGCKDIANADFKATTIASRSGDTLAEPMKMAFDLLAAPGEDAKGKVDVYFTERLGKVRKFDSKTAKVMTLATISLNIDEQNSSDGVLGIALDPAFKTNNNVFIYYTFVSNAEKNWRVSRFTLNAAHTKLDLATEAIVIKIPINSGSKHPGGALKFDKDGDLYITTGNDYKVGNDFPLYSSPNTNDLRGKILRIHPTADGKYTVPEGNLFKANTANTRPEIYIMGNRNPYTLALDPVRKWVLWGDVGPDNVDMDGKPMNAAGSAEKTEEYDLALAPGNYGYPFFAGDYATKPGANAAAPTMPAGYAWDGAQPGLTTLPPAVAPIYSYKKSCAITGPLYRYDGDLNSSVKFPPHFNRKWLVSDFNGHASTITAFTLTEDGKTISAQEKVIGIPLDAPLDIESGPDGALYVNNYAGYRTSVATTSLVRIDYLGDCRPLLPKLETSTSTSPFAAGRRGPDFQVMQFREILVDISTAGDFKLDARDILGRPMANRSGHGPSRFALAEIRKPGVYFISVTTPEGQTTRKIVRE